MVVDICHRGLPSSWLHPWLADSGFRGAGGLPGRAPRGTPCGNAGTGRLLPEAFEFLRLGRVARPHRVNSTFQHTRLMTQIAQLRLQRLDLDLRTLAFANRALLCAVDFALQTRIRSALPLDLQQRALLRGLQTRLGQFRAGALPVEFGAEIGAGLCQGGIPFTQCLLLSNELKLIRISTKVGTFSVL